MVKVAAAITLMIVMRKAAAITVALADTMIRMLQAAQAAVIIITVAAVVAVEAATAVAIAGGAAVQVFASGSRGNAEQIKRSMDSRGLNAVIDQVDGLYKVRVPFGSESEARANLARVRSASGQSGAFVTFR